MRAYLRFWRHCSAVPWLPASVARATGAGGRIRTCVAVRRRFYRPLDLTTLPPLRGAAVAPAVHLRAAAARWSPRGDSNPLTYRLQIGCAAIAPLGLDGKPTLTRVHRLPVNPEDDRPSVYESPRKRVNASALVRGMLGCSAARRPAPLPPAPSPAVRERVGVRVRRVIDLRSHPADPPSPSPPPPAGGRGNRSARAPVLSGLLASRFAPVHLRMSVLGSHLSDELREVVVALPRLGVAAR